jgi:hypothetical protein
LLNPQQTGHRFATAKHTKGKTLPASSSINAFILAPVLLMQSQKNYFFHSMSVLAPAHLLRQAQTWQSAGCKFMHAQYSLELSTLDEYAPFKQAESTKRVANAT